MLLLISFPARSTYRTAICKDKRAVFKDTLSEDLFVSDLEVFHFYLLFSNFIFLIHCNICLFLFCLEFQDLMEKTKENPLNAILLCQTNSQLCW
jgi:hypothetical protein